uniref:Uncharacterized protein n=1 Tax=Setaria italica TaxID=4555 RepID=K4AHH1_SETIT
MEEVSMLICEITVFNFPNKNVTLQNSALAFLYHQTDGFPPFLDTELANSVPDQLSSLAGPPNSSTTYSENKVYSSECN